MSVSCHSRKQVSGTKTCLTQSCGSKKIFLGFAVWALQKGWPCKRACLAMMKPCLGKRKRSGNAAPAKRMPFPDVIQSKLDNALHSYTRRMGMKQAFNLHNYKNLQGQQAESPQSMAQLAPLLDALLGVSSSAKIKYKALKQSCTYLIQEWGVSLWQVHWKDLEAGLLAGRCADSVGVLLKHWRRISNKDENWQKVVSKLDEADATALERLRKNHPSMAAMKVLKKNDPEVTADSLGFPKMTAMSQDGETDEEEAAEDEESHSTNQGLLGSPPPVTKKDWRELVGKVQKKPVCKKACKRPSSAMQSGQKPCKRAGSDVGSGTGPCKRASPGTEKVLIHQNTITLGGGKNQSYLQHVPGPGKNKRLIAAVTLSQASRTPKTHQQLVELLLPYCKKPNATKGFVLAERGKLLPKFAK